MQNVTLIYDGECPFCSMYAKYMRLKEASGGLQLINAREGDHPAVIMKTARHRYADDGVPWSETLEGGYIVSPGDWIATGVKGEHWPIKPDVFAATYVENVTSPADAILAQSAELAELRKLADAMAEALEDASDLLAATGSKFAAFDCDKPRAAYQAYKERSA